MARERPHLFALNGGAVSPLALGRTDLARMRITAEQFHNCFPLVIGPLQFRPGFEYDGSTTSDAAARHLPFVFSATDTALVEVSNGLIRPLIDGQPISRVSVATTITNGNFSSGTGWTLASADINTTVANALVMQVVNRGLTASATRTFTVAGGDQAKEHAVRVTVTRGTTRFKLGSASGGQDIIAETELLPGIHSLAFTPNVGTVYIEFNTQSETQVVIDDVSIEAAGSLTLPSPWLTADLFDARFVQSADVIFVSHASYQTRRIERRAARSWSITLHISINGPWIGKTANVTLDPTVRTGNGTMTSSSSFFTPTMVGAMFELTHNQTTVRTQLGGNDVYTDWVRVAGYTKDATLTNALEERIVNIIVTGTWSGRLTFLTSDSPDVHGSRASRSPPISRTIGSQAPAARSSISGSASCLAIILPAPRW